MRHVDEKFYLMLGMLMLYEGMHELFGLQQVGSEVRTQRATAYK